MFDSEVILKGEFRCSSLSGIKGFAGLHLRVTTNHVYSFSLTAICRWAWAGKGVRGGKFMMKLCRCDKAGGCCKIYIYFFLGGGGLSNWPLWTVFKADLATLSPLHHHFWFRWCCIVQLKHSTRIALYTSKPAQQITQNIQGLKLDRNISALTKKKEHSDKVQYIQWQKSLHEWRCSMFCHYCSKIWKMLIASNDFCT